MRSMNHSELIKAFVLESKVYFVMYIGLGVLSIA